MKKLEIYIDQININTNRSKPELKKMLTVVKNRVETKVVNFFVPDNYTEPDRYINQELGVTWPRRVGVAAMI